MFLPLLSLYGYTSNCNIKLNIQVSVCFCKEAGAHFFACLQKILKISGKIRKNSAKRKWKEKSSKPKKNYRKHPLKRHPFFESKWRAFWSYSIHFAKAANSSRWFVRRSFQNFFKIYLLFLWKVPSWLVGAVFRKFFNSRGTQYPLLLKISEPFLQKNLKQLRTNPKKFPSWLVEAGFRGAASTTKNFRKGG